MFDSQGEYVYPEDVLDPEELASYYASIDYEWWTS